MPPKWTAWQLDAGRRVSSWGIWDLPRELSSHMSVSDRDTGVLPIIVSTQDGITDRPGQITQTLLLVGLGPSSEKHAMAELRPVRHQSGLTHSGSLIVQGD